MNHTDSKSIQQNTLNPQLSSIIWISCSVHILALALNDAAKECTYNELIDHIREAAKFLRLKNIVNLLGVKCPLWAPTRWTGMFDIAFWMLKNNSKIISAITASLTSEKAYDFSDFIIDGVTTAASIAFCILLPFYHATHILEADDIPAAYTIPVVESALMHMKEICSRIDVSEEIVKTITKCTERCLKLSQSGRILQLLYSLTPYGRKNLRESGELEISGHDSIEIPVPFTDKPTDAEEAMLNSIFENKEKFNQQGNAVKESFASYRGKLLNQANGRKLVEHEGELDMYDEEEESIDVSDIVIDYMKKGDDAEEIDSEISSDESTSEYSDEDEYFDLADEDVVTETHGVFEDSIRTRLQ